MNTPIASEKTIELSDVIRVVRRNLTCVLLSALVGGVGAYAFSTYITKKFKSICILNIQASYFQNGMVNDLVPGVYDAGEQGSQRLALLRLALSNDFLDQMGEKYGFYTRSTSPDDRVRDRDDLMKRIEYFATNGTAYQISGVASDGMTAFKFTQDVLNQMKTTLIERRRDTLILSRDAIQSRVTALALALQDVSSAMVFQQGSLKEELDKIEARIESLTNQYTDKHPEVLRLKERAEAMRALLKSKPSSGEGGAPRNSIFVNAASKAPMQEVYNELVKKLNYLNIVVDMEGDPQNVPYLTVIQQPEIPSTPISPKKRFFALGGLAFGLFLGAILSLLAEIKRGSFLAPSNASDTLGAPFLGELPLLHGRESVKLLDGPGENAVRKSIPFGT